MTNNVVVLDTSVVVDGWVSQQVESGEYKGYRIVIPNAVLAEIEHMANQKRDIGRLGMNELERLRALAESGAITLDFVGERPTPEQIHGSHAGELDALVRDVASKMNATLVTSDSVQAAAGHVIGLDVVVIEKKRAPSIVTLEEFFDDRTMSVHLVENNPPRAKRGEPGDWELVDLSDHILTYEELEQLANTILERARQDRASFVEIEELGATVVQLRNYRIAIARPPFSDKMEISAIRPIIKLDIDYYGLSPKLMNRLETRAEGILISGSPGSGKSTFAAALAEFYSKKGNVVKTLEQPRDLQVTDDIVQYAPLEGSMEKAADVLLLVRPDYVVYDELRKDADFKAYADLRSAGVGMVGVVHAGSAIDAIQRLILGGRVELGQLPSTVDTVLHVEAGRIAKVASLSLKVKLPTGMSSQQRDLARPVVEVRDFERGVLEYEMFSFGGEKVVVPVRGESRTVFGAPQATVDRGTPGENVPVSVSYSHKKVTLYAGRKYAKMRLDVFANDQYILATVVGRNGEASIRIKTRQGSALVDALEEGATITAKVTE
ncbi:MAG: ATPase [Candidatus Thorarchaeota archaeon]|nr:MAG: ATPase [Candidatus Thorarchaeota archaeon]